jgi:hypothetical protein
MTMRPLVLTAACLTAAILVWSLVVQAPNPSNWMMAIQGVAYIAVGSSLAAAVYFRHKRRRAEAPSMPRHRKTAALVFWWWSGILGLVAIICLVGGVVRVLLFIALLSGLQPPH